MRIQILVILFLGLSIFSFGQTINLSFEHVGSKEGLRSNYNNFIHQDSRGFLWLSYLEGLYRFDGIAVQDFSDGNEVGAGIAGKYIQSEIFEQSQGDLWFTTYGYVNQYQRKKDSFDAFQLLDDEGEVLQKSYCLFHLEQDSILWIRVQNFIYTYNILSGQQQKIIETEGVRFAVDTSSTGAIQDIYVALWDSGSGFEHIHIDQNRKAEKKTFLDQGIQDLGIDFIKITDVLIPKSKEIWLVSSTNGLLHFQTETETVQAFNLPDENDRITDAEVLDSNNLILVGLNSGVWTLDLDKYLFAKSNLQNNAANLQNNDINEIYVSSRDHVWITNNIKSGLDHSWLYRNTFANPFEKLFDYSVVVYSIIEDKENRVWCSTKDAGIFVFDDNGNLIRRIEYDQDLSRGKNSLFKNVYQLSLNEDGQIWAINDRFVYALSIESNAPQIIYDSDNIKIHDLVHLSIDEKIILTDQGGFSLSSLNGKKYTRKENIIKPGVSQLFQFIEGKDSLIYFPQSDKTINIYKKGKNPVYPEKQIPFDLNIYSIWEEEKSEGIWVGATEGLFWFDEKEEVFIPVFKENNPLKDIQILNIIGDENGNLWLGTSLGLWSFNIESKEVFQYREEDGISSTQFALFAGIKGANGFIWFATNEGLIVFDPDNIRPYPYQPEVQIKKLKVNNYDYKSDTTIGETKNINLKHFQNNLEFKAVAITDYLPKLNRIFFRLHGYNEKWTEVENGGLIQFTKVPYGDYELQIFGKNSNGVKGEIKKVSIFIKAPYWLTFEFWIIIGFVIFFIGYRSFKFVLKQKLKKQELNFKRQEEMKEALQEERNRIATEMHDDLGGELNTIQILLKKIPKNLLPKNALESFEKAESYASRSIENMRDIIWAMNNSNDQLPELIAYTRRFVLEYFEDHELECKANVPRSIPDVSISGEKRKNVFLCVKECAHNIVKHANATQVNIIFHWENQQLFITIEDNGKGIDLNKENHFGNGLKNFEKRMDQIGGTLKIDNNGGTRFTFIIPIIFEEKIL